MRHAYYVTYRRIEIVEMNLIRPLPGDRASAL
jgi:hypothetical protein